MAFLCPMSRRGKKKKSNENDKNLTRSNSGLGLNHGMGRITGSSSIETLVRVGIEKEHGLSPDSKMVVLYDFTPCVDDELEVKRGQIVNILYRENDWVYVIGQDSRQEGFIPHSYCAPYNTQLADLAIKKKLPRNGNITAQAYPVNEVTDPTVEIANKNNINCGSGLDLQSSLKHSQGSLSSVEADYLPFAKDPSGRFIVLYTFIARDENDVSVERGEFVTVLNKEDPDWYWIVRSDGQEGFVPSGFVYPAENILQSQEKFLNNDSSNNNIATPSNINNNNNNNSNNNNNQFPLNGNTIMGNLNNSNNNNSISNNNNNSNISNNNNGPDDKIVTSNNNEVLGNEPFSCNNYNPTAAQVPQIIGSDDLRYHGTELVMLYDYKAQAPDDLSVRRGEWIYADLTTQTVEGWLWVFAPKTRKYGFIPKAYARPPHQTSL